MRIDGLSQHPKVSQPQSRSATVRAKRESDHAGDVVEISQGAQEIAELRALARTTPSESNQRLQEIRDRLRSGYYDSRQVRQQIADRLLAADSMQEVVADIGQFRIAKEELTQVPETRRERVEVTRQRVDSGFYDRPQIRRDIADRILDELA